MGHFVWAPTCIFTYVATIYRSEVHFNKRTKLNANFMLNALLSWQVAGTYKRSKEPSGSIKFEELSSWESVSFSRLTLLHGVSNWVSMHTCRKSYDFAKTQSRWRWYYMWYLRSVGLSLWNFVKDILIRLFNNAVIMWRCTSYTGEFVTTRGMWVVVASRSHEIRNFEDLGRHTHE
jgi:hypothetical protein